MGHEGIYSFTMQMDKLDKCKSCSKNVYSIKVNEDQAFNPNINIIEFQNFK